MSEDKIRKDKDKDSNLYIEAEIGILPGIYS